MDILVIATHLDDEVIGCGGAILKHVNEGDSVYVCFICGGTSVRYPNKDLVETRRSHGRKVAKLLGVKEIFFQDFPIIMLDTIPQLEIVTALEKVIFKIKPQVIYTHYSDDINSDHRSVYEATMVWCRPSKTPFLKKVLLYEIFGSNRSFNPNYYISIDKYVEQKLEALSLYTTEVDAQTRNLDTIKKVAQYRGAEINCEYAEGFILYRQIE
ncbi:PIG-L deacetylase family protein [Clostridium estertheticum]|uniref:PIG-L deacetylase family protein n=1 Tax=Clostridium estertheticum TaxID=238834 RepID=UPI001C7D9D05|nr:PIG-L family deacetylase [Clostridium estertheticum]MBX4264175.1 PIG-L family deacetylase [Clostridium estertheticum]WLC89034.1 PIG-L family deacetylase [Clostridium estertheticum]